MEWTTSFLPDQQVIVIQTQGDADESGSLEMAKSILKTMQEHNILLCLIDHSAIRSVSGDVTQVYYRPRELHGAGVPSGIRIAEVVLAAHETHFGFFETVCRNSGLNLRLFQDRESAMQWLTG